MEGGEIMRLTPNPPMILLNDFFKNLPVCLAYGAKALTLCWEHSNGGWPTENTEDTEWGSWFSGIQCIQWAMNRVRWGGVAAGVVGCSGTL